MSRRKKSAPQARPSWDGSLYLEIKGDRLEGIDLEAPPPPSLDLPYLSMDLGGLWMNHPDLRRPLQVVFDAGALARRAAQGGELLYRAIGVHRLPQLSVLDATAGLGRESFLLASTGAQVIACERHPALYWLTYDALRRCQNAITSNLSLYLGDARDHLQELTPDVVYLDPMFPARQKSAAIGREAVVLKTFSKSPSREEEAELLSLALERSVYRVVVKRPIKAPPLAGPPPTSALRGRVVRYDLYGLKSFPKGGQQTEG